MMVFIERLDEVGSLSCLVSIFIYIAYLRLELIYTVILSVVVYPMP
jgi:cytochrome c oxidase subunit IV